MLLAPVRGSLYIVVILTSTVFAMATGIVGAAVTVLGIMAGPIMIKTKYDPVLSAGAITAGGTLGILIPPSVMLIVMGPVLGVSVADLYAAAFGPGFLLASHLPRVPDRALDDQSEARSAGAEGGARHRSGGDPAGSGGRRAAARAAHRGHARLDPRRSRHPDRGLGRRRARRASMLAIVYRRLTYAGIKQAVVSATLTSSMVLLLAVTSNIFGAVFARLGTADWITTNLTSLPVPPLVMLGFVVVLLFLLGWPFEWPAIILVFLPIFYPVVDALKPALSQSFGIPPELFMVWFGALVAVTMQTAYLSPPVAMSAYYLKQVVKEWSLGTIYKGHVRIHGPAVHRDRRGDVRAADRHLPADAPAGRSARGDDRRSGRQPEPS